MEKQGGNDVNRKCGGSAAEPAGAVFRKFVTEMLSYDGGRQVTVYVPPDSPEAVVFAGDGQLISRWGAALEEATVPPAMIVGARRADRRSRRRSR
jgi:hypothetical protein